MESVLTSVINGILGGTPEVLFGLGWVFYILERYYFQPKKEKATAELIAKMDEKLDVSRANYQDLGEKVVNTLHKFTTLLEVIKDRQERN